MEKLNKILTIVVGAALLLAIVMSGGQQPEPINDPWFQQAVLSSAKPVVVKFGADWCGPCRGMDAAMDTLQPQYASRAKFLKIDIDKTPNLFAHYGSGSGIPQIMLFREGRVVAQQKGFGGEDGLKQWLESSL